MVHDGADVPEGPANLDTVRVRFDEERLISDAGLFEAPAGPDQHQQTPRPAPARSACPKTTDRHHPGPVSVPPNRD